MATGARKNQKTPATKGKPGALDALAEAVESGAGLPAVARAAAKALDASVALIDRSSAVLAVASASASEESRLLEVGDGVETVELRVADAAVGELRYRPRGGSAPDSALGRMVSTLLALEVERSRAPEWASEEAAGDFVRAVLGRRLTDRGDTIARAAELGAELEDGSGVVIARAVPRSAQAGDWRARVLTLTVRAARAVAHGALAAQQDAESADAAPAAAEVAAIVPAPDSEGLVRAAHAVQRELSEGLTGFLVTAAHSRWAADPADLYRAGQEAKLAVNVGEADGVAVIAFEETGSYRLLLPALSEDRGELERFYAETIEPLSAYDEQYETELVATVETYLENDGNVAATAQTLFTHRHTVRYRLERVRELCGHDVTSTEGREKLGLGLKAMRVLGISAPGGPALEPGTEAGKVRRTTES